MSIRMMVVQYLGNWLRLPKLERDVETIVTEDGQRFRIEQNAIDAFASAWNARTDEKRIAELEAKRDWWRDECNEMYAYAVDMLAEPLHYPIGPSEPHPSIMVMAATQGRDMCIDELEQLVRDMEPWVENKPARRLFVKRMDALGIEIQQ